LIPSERSCPAGFKDYEDESSPIAASMNDLIPIEWKNRKPFDFVCYGKI